VVCSLEFSCAHHNEADIKRNEITQNQIPLDKCVSFSIDNASINMGKRNSIKSNILVKNPDVYFVALAVLAIWHITQHIKEEAAFLELLDLILRI